MQYINLRVRVQPDTNTYQIQQEFKALLCIEMICKTFLVKCTRQRFDTESALIIYFYEVFQQCNILI